MIIIFIAIFFLLPARAFAAAFGFAIVVFVVSSSFFVVVL